MVVQPVLRLCEGPTRAQERHVDHMQIFTMQFTPKKKWMIQKSAAQTYRSVKIIGAIRRRTLYLYLHMMECVRSAACV
jgi:hypothetical protein